MRRREFVVAFAGAAVGWSPASAEVKTPRVGFVQPGSREENQGLLDAFRDDLSTLGWSDSSNIAILDRWAEDRTETLPGIVKELIGSGAAVLSLAGARRHSPRRGRARRFRSSLSASMIPSPLVSPTPWVSPAATPRACL